MRDDKTIIRKVSALYALKNNDTGEVFNITNNITIGRQEGCDIVLLQGQVSRLHASLKVSGVALTLKDENSSNGTFLNGEAINEVVLRPNDLIKFDIHEFIVVALSTGETTSSAAETMILSTPVEEEIADERFVEERVNDTLVVNANDEDIADTLIPVESITKAFAEKKASTRQKSKAQVAGAHLGQDPYQTVEFDGAEAWTDSENEKNPTLRMDKFNTQIMDAVTNLEQSFEQLTETTCIYGYDPSIANEEFPLEKNIILIGKSPLADITIKDGSISSRHAELSFENDEWSIEDLDSTNGTFLNGDAVSELTILEMGDVIQVGLIQLIFGQANPHTAVKPANKNSQWLFIGGLIGLAVLIGAAVAYKMLA